MKMLIALDLNDNPEALVAEASQWGQKMGATIDFIYADRYFAPASLVVDLQMQALVAEEGRQIRASERKKLEDMHLQLPEAVRGQVLVVSGDPVDVVTGLAEDYDVVVVGTNGRTGLQRFWLGSVAERIVRLVPCTVIVLRPAGD